MSRTRCLPAPSPRWQAPLGMSTSLLWVAAPLYYRTISFDSLLFSANDSSLRGRIGAAKKYRYRVTKRKLTSAWQSNEVGSLNFDIDTVVKIHYSVKVAINSAFCVRYLVFSSI